MASQPSKRSNDNTTSKLLLLYVDAGSFKYNFFRPGDHWSLEKARQGVMNFCQAAQASGWTHTVVVFSTTDHQQYTTHQARQKWRSQCEKNVQKGTQSVPYGDLRLLGDLFAEQQGVTVRYYSTTAEMDCSDTLARHAQADGASAVLSKDLDFLCFEDATYDLYTNYKVQKTLRKRGRVEWRLVLVKHQNDRDNDQMMRPSSSRRELGPPPRTMAAPNPFQECIQNARYLEGSPSPMAQLLGNLHIHCTPLRQALYHVLKIQTPVEEEFPVLVVDDASGKTSCTWIKQSVEPDPALVELLYSPAQAVQHFTQPRPAECRSNNNWIKHQFALRSVVAHICYAAATSSSLQSSTSPQSTLLETLEPLMDTMDIPVVPEVTKKSKKKKKKKQLSEAAIARHQQRHKQQQQSSRQQPSHQQQEPDNSYKPLVVNHATRWKPHSCEHSSVSVAGTTDNDASNQTAKMVQNHGGGGISNEQPPDNNGAAVLTTSIRLDDSRLLNKLLNKLTPTNFDTIVPIFCSDYCYHMIHTSNERVAHVVSTILTRAALDARYASTLALLCARLANTYPAPSFVFDNDGTDNHNNNTLSFREALLGHCRTDIEDVGGTRRREISALRLQGEELRVARRRYNGAKRFIGELYNHHVFSLEEILYFVDTLLGQVTTLQGEEGGGEAAEDDDAIDEVSLEGLCVLLTSCGKLLEGAVPAFEAMQHCWGVLQDLVDLENDHPERHDPMSFRSKHLVQELLELRSAAWNPVRYGARQRNEMVAKPLQEEDRILGRNVKRRNGRKRGKGKKQVHFESPGGSGQGGGQGTSTGSNGGSVS